MANKVIEPTDEHNQLATELSAMPINRRVAGPQTIGMDGQDWRRRNIAIALAKAENAGREAGIREAMNHIKCPEHKWEEYCGRNTQARAVLALLDTPKEPDDK